MCKEEPVRAIGGLDPPQNATPARPENRPAYSPYVRTLDIDDMAEVLGISITVLESALDQPSDPTTIMNYRKRSHSQCFIASFLHFLKFLALHQERCRRSTQQSV